MRPMFQVCIDNRYEGFWNLLAARSRRLQAICKGLAVGPVLTYCNIHKWAQAIRGGKCSKCSEEASRE